MAANPDTTDLSTDLSTGVLSSPPSSIQDLQLRTREKRGFAALEATLPDFCVRSEVASSSSWPGQPEPAPAPAPQPVTGSDSVWLLDNVAYHNAAAGRWEAEYAVAVMAQLPDRSAVRQVVRALAWTLGRTGDQEALATMEKRLAPFLQKILTGRQVQARLGRDWPLLFHPREPRGVSHDVQDLPVPSKTGVWLPTTVEVPPGVDGMLAMQTLFVDDAAVDGWGVISDVDDTIKITQTGDPRGILQTTFVDEPKPVAGMPALYRFLHQHMNSPGAPFFYLSASPYNLYPLLRGFCAQHYPAGPLLLRDTAPTSAAGLLAMLTLDTLAYKTNCLQKIHAWLPGRSFVCIGDSTQADPEAYAEMYRKYPGWIRLILIRKVADIAALGLAAKNEAARFERAFAGVPASVWHVFEDPTECYAYVQQAVDRASPTA